MAKVKNNFTSPLVVGDITVRPGATVEINDTAFEQWSQGQTAQTWLDQKFITREGARAEVNPEGDEPEADNPVDERAALFEEARSLGLNPNNNISTDNLRRRVEEARAAE